MKLESIKLQGRDKGARGAVFFDLLPFGVSYFATTKEFTYYIYIFPFCITLTGNVK